MITRLQKEVWALGRCSGCGGCTAACAKGMLYWGEEQHPLLEERRKSLGLSRLKLRTCEVCDRFCEASCPRLVDWTPRETLHAVSARSAGVVRQGNPNDIAQALLVAARSADLIDGAVMLDVDPWTLQPVARIATTVGEIAGGAGMQYLWAPVLSKLNEAIFELGLSKLAVVGSPCVAEGVRRLQAAENERLRLYRQALRFSIAHFCTGMYMPSLVTEFLERSQGIAAGQIKGLQVSATEGALTATLWDGTARSVPLAEVQPFARQGCAICHDYLGESADVALGTIGALPGHATLITRSMGGETLVRTAWSLGLLETLPQVDEVALAAAQAEKDRRERAEALADFRILMLDALANPGKRAQVRKQYVSLYGASQGPGARRKEELDGNCHGCTGSGC